MPNNELQELLSARFKGYTHSSDESVWSAIESQLNAESSDRAGIWFWVFNGLAASLLVGLMLQSGLNKEASLSANQVEIGNNSITKNENEKDANNQPIEANKEATTQTKSNNSNIETIVENSTTNDFKLAQVITTKSPAKSKIKGTIKPTQISETKTEFSKLIVQNETSQIDYSNLSIRPLANSIYLREISNGLPEFNNKKGSYLEELPIHIGLEFTHLHRGKHENYWDIASDSNNAWANDELATSRKFEFSLFSQFDFTKRFSASIGIGYSSSKFDFTNTPTSSALASSLLIESQLQLLTIPIQTKIALLQKKRFGLSAGLTFQGEFGRISHTKIVVGEILTGSLPALSEESTETSKETIRHFAFEPFVQFSVGISSRLTTFANLGYRSYFGQSNSNNIPGNRRHYFNADVGIQFRIR